MPEFPLSKPDIAGSVPPPRERKRDSNSERRWRLYSISYYANLQPSQIVREMDAADRGWNPDQEKGHEHAPRAVRQDGTADADRQRENTPEPGQIGPRTVDERRYVIDPIVEGHTFEGLWTGGPVVHAVVQGHKVLRQTLTRTWCAGHGYTVNAEGAYVAVWPNGVPEGIGGVHGTSGNDDSDSDPEVREYRTAKECLKECRPWMDGRLSPYMAFRKDIPSSFTREVYWREFTHESITPLESLTREELVEVVSYHFGEKVGPTVMDAHTRVDPQTNTVIFVCSLLYTDLAEPDSPEALLELPCVDGTCSRETLRMFGWGQFRNGEGYEYKHYFRWPRLKDTPATRKIIEFIEDNKDIERAVYRKDEDDSNSDAFAESGTPFLLALLAMHRHNSKAPGWWTDYEDSDSDIDVVDQLDNTGRLKTTAFAPSRVPVQHYRIADQKTDVADDGSLTFTIIVDKVEWHGYDDGQNYEAGGTRQLASVTNPQGYGATEHRVIPSVPRENAIPTMNAIEGADGYELITDKQQSEGQKGSSDVSFKKRKLYDYLGNDDGHTPDIPNLDSNPFNATTYRYDPNTNTYVLDWNFVNPKKTQDLVDKAREQLGGSPTVTVTHHQEGYDTIHIVGKGRGAHHLDEWLVEADWFKHETVEQWIGVSLVWRDGIPYSFQYRPIVYITDETTGDQTIDWDATNAGELVTVLFSSIRGDLDANWMGSDPQDASDSDSDSPMVYVTTGMEPNGKILLSPPPVHADHHGSGWSSSSWTDPDDGETEPPASSENPTANGFDKLRSHCLTRIGRRVNEDGTYNITVTRIYPHQRYWTWDTEGENKDGDTRTVHHFAYRNWPSRKAIQTDIIEKIKEKIEEDGGSDGDDWEDGWSLNGSISVNEFGLVDAPGMTLAPAWGNDGRIRRAKAKTFTDHLDEVKVKLEKTYTCPKQFRNQQTGTYNNPAEGYWWRNVAYYIYSGHSCSYTEAMREYGSKTAILEGSEGVIRTNNKHGVNAHWRWHVVYKIEVLGIEKWDSAGSDGDGNQHAAGDPKNPDDCGWKDTKVVREGGHVISSGDGVASNDTNGSPANQNNNNSNG